MLHSEFGRYSLKVNIKVRILTCWFSVINGRQNKLAFLVYKIMLNDFETGFYAHKWIECVKNILQAAGRNDIWISQTVQNPNSLKCKIHEFLKGQDLQLVQAQMDGSPKGITYRIFKHNIKFEPYLKLLPESLSFPILKFRLSNHKLPVETGRWENIILDDRKYLLCQSESIGNEFHYLF